MDTPTVDQIVRQWLLDNGYDGLVWLSPGEACGCSFRDGAGLFPCGEPASECQAAYRWSDGLMYTEPERAKKGTVSAAHVAWLEAYVARLEAEVRRLDIDWDRELERLHNVVSDACTCSGHDLRDPEACPVCMVWRMIRKARQKNHTE